LGATAVPAGIRRNSDCRKARCARLMAARHHVPAPLARPSADPFQSWESAAINGLAWVPGRRMRICFAQRDKAVNVMTEFHGSQASAAGGGNTHNYFRSPAEGDLTSQSQLTTCTVTGSRPTSELCQVR
jgi:hypothetical protein